jgi:hypothetical protein
MENNMESMKIILEAVAAMVAKHYGMSLLEAQQWDLSTSVDDEFGWANGAPVVMWESGPDDWTLDVRELPDITAYLTPLGLYMSPVNHWCMAIHKI